MKPSPRQDNSPASTEIIQIQSKFPSIILEISRHLESRVASYSKFLRNLAHTRGFLLTLFAIVSQLSELSQLNTDRIHSLKDLVEIQGDTEAELLSPQSKFVFSSTSRGISHHRGN